MLKQMALTSEMFACLCMPSLSSFRCFTWKQNIIKLQLSGLARRNALSALCSPYVLSSPPTSSETLPPERLVRARWEMLLWKDDVLYWGVVTTCACFAPLQLFWYICFVLFFQVWVCIPSVRTKHQDRHYLSSLSKFLKPFYRRKPSFFLLTYLHQLIQLVFILKCGGGFIQWDAGWTVCSLAQRWELTLCAVSLQHNTHEFKWLHLLFFFLCALIFPHLSF